MICILLARIVLFSIAGLVVGLLGIALATPIFADSSNYNQFPGGIIATVCGRLFQVAGNVQLVNTPSNVNKFNFHFTGTDELGNPVNGYEQSTINPNGDGIRLDKVIFSNPQQIYTASYDIENGQFILRDVSCN